MNSAHAGPGEIEMMIKAMHDKKVPVKVVDKGGGIKKGYFMPKEPIRHLLFVSFGKESVPGMFHYFCNGPGSSQNLGGLQIK